MSVFPTHSGLGKTPRLAPAETMLDHAFAGAIAAHKNNADILGGELPFASPVGLEEPILGKKRILAEDPISDVPTKKPKFEEGDEDESKDDEPMPPPLRPACDIDEEDEDDEQEGWMPPLMRPDGTVITDKTKATVGEPVPKGEPGPRPEPEPIACTEKEGVQTEGLAHPDPRNIANMPPLEPETPPASPKASTTVRPPAESPPAEALSALNLETHRPTTPVLSAAATPESVMPPLSLGGDDTKVVDQAFQPGAAFSAAYNVVMAGSSLLAAHGRNLLRRPVLRRQTANPPNDPSPPPPATQGPNPQQITTHSQASSNDSNPNAHLAPKVEDTASEIDPKPEAEDYMKDEDEDEKVEKVDIVTAPTTDAAAGDVEVKEDGQGATFIDTSPVLAFDASNQTGFQPMAPATRAPGAQVFPGPWVPCAPATRVAADGSPPQQDQQQPNVAPAVPQGSALVQSALQASDDTNVQQMPTTVVEVVTPAAINEIRRLAYRIEDQIIAIQQIEPMARAMQSIVTRQRRLQDSLKLLESFLNSYM